MEVDSSLTILYVADLGRAVAFYDVALELQKTVSVPVYVEYRLNDGARLGLMAQGNTRHFLGDELGARRPSDGSPRAELYLHISGVESVVARLKQAGAVCTSPLAARDWGDRAAYFMDPDGYVLAVAEKLPPATQ